MWVGEWGWNPGRLPGVLLSFLPTGRPGRRRPTLAAKTQANTFFPLCPQPVSTMAQQPQRSPCQWVGRLSAGCLGCTARGQRQGQEGHGPRRGSRHVPENELTPGSPKNTRNLRPGVGPAGFPRKKRRHEGGVPGSGRLVAVGCPCLVSWKLGPDAESQKPKGDGKIPLLALGHSL